METVARLRAWRPLRNPVGPPGKPWRAGCGGGRRQQQGRRGGSGLLRHREAAAATPAA